MTVYHGSNVEVREPKILKPNRELDFGNGFYTTTNLDQAIAFARRIANNRGTGVPTVSVYEIDLDAAFSVCFASALSLSFIRFKGSEAYDE